MRSSFLFVFLAGMVLPGCTHVAEAVVHERDIRLRSGAEIPVRIHAATGHKLLLWLPSEHGQRPEEAEAAARLARAGIEVWMADMLEAYFLPPLMSSLDRIPAADTANLIGVAHRESGKTVYLLAAGRGGKTALEGAFEWRLRWAPKLGDRVLGGAVLIYPNLYVATPRPGQPARYLPVVRETRLDIAVLQPQLSPWYWYLDRQQQALAGGGGRVRSRVLPGVRNRFYFRPDASEKEQALGGRLHELILQALSELQRLDTKETSGP